MKNLKPRLGYSSAPLLSFDQNASAAEQIWLGVLAKPGIHCVTRFEKRLRLAKNTFLPRSVETTIVWRCPI